MSSKLSKFLNLKFLLFLILLIGLVLRISCVDFYLPTLTHPDEGHIIIGAELLNEGKKVKKYGRPNRVSMKTIKFSRKIQNLWFSKVLKKEVTRSDIYIIARYNSLLLGVLAIFLSYLIGSFFSEKTGIIFAFLTAFNPLLIKNSVYVTPEIYNYFFSLATIFFCLKYLNKNKIIFLIMATIFCSLNAAEKYPGLLSLVTVYFTILISNYKNSDLGQTLVKTVKQSIGQTVIFAAAFLVIFPELITDFSEVYAKVSSNTGNQHFGTKKLSQLGTFMYYTNVFVKYLGIITCLFILLSFYFCYKNKESAKFTIVLLSGIFIQIGLCFISMQFERYSVPMLTAPLFLVAYGMAHMHHIKSKYLKIPLSAIRYFCLFCILLSGLATAISMNAFETRELALNWYAENGINKQNSCYHTYTGLSTGKYKNLSLKFTNLHLNEKKIKNKSCNYIILSSRVLYRYVNNKKYKKHQMLINKIRKDRYLLQKFIPNIKTTLRKSQISELNQNLNLVNRFIKGERLLIGPIIEVYENHIGGSK